MLTGGCGWGLLAVDSLELSGLLPGEFRRSSGEELEELMFRMRESREEARRALVVVGVALYACSLLRMLQRPPLCCPRTDLDVPSLESFDCTLASC